MNRSVATLCHRLVILKDHFRVLEGDLNQRLFAHNKT